MLLDGIDPLGGDTSDVARRIHVKICDVQII